ncbi:MAG: hypothetical protein ACTTH6_03255 [Candidatus Altimarinota bacterium]
MDNSTCQKKKKRKRYNSSCFLLLIFINMSNFGNFWKQTPEWVRAYILSNINDNDPYWNFIGKYQEILDSEENQQSGKQILSDKEFDDIVNYCATLSLIADNWAQLKEDKPGLAMITQEGVDSLGNIIQSMGALATLDFGLATKALIKQGSLFLKMIDFLRKEGLNVLSEGNSIFKEFASIETDLKNLTKKIDERWDARY